MIFSLSSLSSFYQTFDLAIAELITELITIIMWFVLNKRNDCDKKIIAILNIYIYIQISISKEAIVYVFLLDIPVSRKKILRESGSPKEQLYVTATCS